MNWWECDNGTIKDIIKCDNDTIKDIIVTIKQIIRTQNIYYVKNKKTPRSMCYNVKKLTSSHLKKKNIRFTIKEVKKAARENGKG